MGKLSCSDISLFQRCRLKWSYASQSRRNLGPARMYAPFFLGSGVHVALEHFYRDRADPVETFARWCTETQETYKSTGVAYDPSEIDKQFVLGVAMLEGYLAEYGQTPERDVDGIRVFVTEQSFSVPVPGTDETFVGTVDGLLTDERGLLWVFETKTYSTLPKLFTHHLQSVAYPWAVQTLCDSGALEERGIPRGTRVYGALYNGLRKQAPSGSTKLPFFHREFVRHSRADLDRFATWLGRIATEMASRDTPIYPAFSWDCATCGYNEPCDAWTRGDDQEEAYVLSSNRFALQPSRGAVYDDA